MDVYVESVLAVAMSMVGYCEKATNAYLLDFERNAGSSNFTRFGAELDEVKYFNGKKNGYQWCTQFLAWCFWMASGKDIAKTKKVLRVPENEENLSAGCEYIRMYFRAAGAYDAVPCVGDPIIFTTTRGSVNADHVGLLKEIGADGTIYTIEGNKDNMVCECKYPRDYWKILGYCHPDWDKHPKYDEDYNKLVNLIDDLTRENAELNETCAELREEKDSMESKWSDLESKISAIREVIN